MPAKLPSTGVDPNRPEWHLIQSNALGIDRNSESDKVAILGGSLGVGAAENFLVVTATRGTEHIYQAACRFDSDKTKNGCKEVLLRIAACCGASAAKSAALVLSFLGRSGPLLQVDYWRSRCHHGEGKGENG